MTSSIACPQCGQPVDLQARLCAHCGVDLVLAALVAEREIYPVHSHTDIAVTPEVLVPRLGEYLVEEGHLAPADLERGLQFQKERAQAGFPLLLGQALRELGLIKADVLDQAITEQILQLHVALKKSNEELEARIRKRTSELEHALEKLGELNQLKANFIANVSHELRTPLTHLKGYLNLLAIEQLGALSELQKKAVRVMTEAETRLEGLIEGLIQFSLFSNGQLTLNLEPTDIGEALQVTLEQALARARSAGILMEIAIERDLCSVSCDKEKITWVVSHLLDNALKFTPAGGTVKLDVSQSNNFVKITVSDTGIGIPVERMAEIFELFHQLDSSPTRRYSGTGMGLALSQQILMLHGSTMTVESKVGKGSQFTFMLTQAMRATQD